MPLRTPSHLVTKRLTVTNPSAGDHDDVDDEWARARSPTLNESPDEEDVEGGPYFPLATTPVDRPARSSPPPWLASDAGAGALPRPVSVDAMTWLGPAIRER
jgi:hypothetical protein